MLSGQVKDATRKEDGLPQELPQALIVSSGSSIQEAFQVIALDPSFPSVVAGFSGLLFLCMRI